ncbi:MAG: hypothetical protein HOP33_12280 [Verrucomicrobia bacterium]|nr:hypothetical protein [Verrucomicrobiota bacterium]
MVTQIKRLTKLLLTCSAVVALGLCKSLSSGTTEVEVAEALHRMGCELEFSFPSGVLCVSRVKVLTPTKECFERLLHLSRLECLEIKYMPSTMDQTNAQALVALSNLRELELNGEFFDDAATSWVRSLTNLTSLKLLYTKLGDESLERLSTLAKLEHLELINYEPLTRRGGEAIARFKSLRSFRFYGRWDRTALMALKELPKLTSVTIGGESVNDELAELRNIASLEEVTIADATITDVTVAHLLEMKKIRSLSLQSCAIHDDALVKVKHLRLRALHFVRCSGRLGELTNAGSVYRVSELHLRH